MPVIKQRRQAERLRNLWNNYMSVPVVIEQFMTWLDSFPAHIVIYGIKQTTRKRAMLQGDMSLEKTLAYATATMQHELERDKVTA